MSCKLPYHHCPTEILQTSTNLQFQTKKVGEYAYAASSALTMPGAPITPLGGPPESQMNWLAKSSLQWCFTLWYLYRSFGVQKSNGKLRS
eukprot:2238261-Rhodomonas_salina.1